MNWKEYQEQAAAFFADIGLSVDIEREVEGVRATHRVDVFVAGAYHGIEFSWVVECKAWKSNIPKEKVLALAAIVQDVGADRGFLLSEKGFQSGAIQSASKTNITLTSLQDLSGIVSPHFRDTLIGAVNWRLAKVKSELMLAKRESDAKGYDPRRISLVGEICIIEFMLQEASNEDYPILYPTKNLEFPDLNSIATYANQYADRAKMWLDENS